MVKISIFLFFFMTLSSVHGAPLTPVQRTEWCKGTSAASWVFAVVHIDRYQNRSDYEFVRKVALTEIGGMKNLSRVARFAAVTYVENFTPEYSTALEEYVVNAGVTKGVTRSELGKTMRSDAKVLIQEKYESCMRELSALTEMPK